VLRGLVRLFDPGNWKVIARALPDRTARQCRDRWTKCLSPVPTGALWTADGDQKLLDRVALIRPG